MKKYLLTIMATLFIVILAACGNTNDGNKENETNNSNAQPDTEEVANNEGNNEENDPEVNEQNDVGEVDGLSAEEIFAKMSETNSAVESFSAKATIEQEMTVGEEVMNTSTVSDMNIVMEPVGIQQTMTMEAPGQGKQELETYMTEDGYFMFDPTQEKWMKFPDAMGVQLIEQTLAQSDIETQMQQFKGMEDSFTVEETDEFYILKFVGDSESLNEQFIEIAQGSLPDELATLGTDLFESMDIKQLEYEVNINKSTFYVEQMDMLMDFIMKVEDQEIHSKQTMKTTYSNYNNVDEITVPQDVIDHAEEVNF